MAFVLSEEQQMLRDNARAFADEKLPVSQLRALRAKGEGFDKAAWKEMAELGFAGVLIPEEFGGSGFGYVDDELFTLVQSLGQVHENALVQDVEGERDAVSIRLDQSTNAVDVQVSSFEEDRRDRLIFVNRLDGGEAVADECFGHRVDSDHELGGFRHGQ